MSSAEQKGSNPQINPTNCASEKNCSEKWCACSPTFRRKTPNKSLTSLTEMTLFFKHLSSAQPQTNCLPSASNLIGLQQPAVTGAPPLTLLTCDPGYMSSQREPPFMTQFVLLIWRYFILLKLKWAIATYWNFFCSANEKANKNVIFKS